MLMFIRYTALAQESSKDNHSFLTKKEGKERLQEKKAKGFQAHQRRATSGSLCWEPATKSPCQLWALPVWSYREFWGCVCPTNDDVAPLATLLHCITLQHALDLMCCQVKQIQVIFHWVAVVKSIPQPDDSWENSQKEGIKNINRAGLTTGANQGGWPRASQHQHKIRPTECNPRRKVPIMKWLRSEILNDYTINSQW